ncbi:MAG: hypothetical protein CFE24_10080 [Flavobacterium sp. BFFFF2]|nr:MAG: hypothetical protein CFE24_10080 [Flavobacterium sp. BFFFF2]
MRAKKGPFFWFVFFGPAKKMNNVVSVEKRQAKTKRSYEMVFFQSMFTVLRSFAGAGPHM